MPINDMYQRFNPHGKPLAELPVIYGFNNGGEPGWWRGLLMAQDGKVLGSHLCSDESYMKHDLGILLGTGFDRHEGFRQYYPDGYRMEFVSLDDVDTHEGLRAAFDANVAQVTGKAPVAMPPQKRRIRIRRSTL